MGDVKNEVGHRLLFVDDQTLMKVVALFGEEAVKVVQVLKRVDEVTDNEIADKTQMSSHMVRKALYKLYDHCLVVLRRSRDKKTQLRYEMNHEFYSCQIPRCKRYTFEEPIFVFSLVHFRLHQKTKPLQCFQ